MKTATSWAELEARLKEHGLHLQKRGRGLVVTDGERMVKASRVHRGSSYAKLAERFGKTFEQWRRDRDALVRAAERAERDRHFRSRLEDRRAVYGESVQDAEEVLRQYERVNGSAREEVRYLAANLERAYRSEDLPAVRRRLGELVRRHGLQRAAVQINDKPKILGRLRGVGLPGFNSETRVRADMYAQRAARNLYDLHDVRQDRRALRPLARQAAVDRDRAASRSTMVGKIVRRLPAARSTEKLLARLATRVGVKAVELVLPAKLVLPVKAALRAVELARERGRGRGR